MKNSYISIIVPVYNVEKFLPRCVDSILSQTFSDFELLLIDDGSEDGSRKICDEYAVIDKRVRVFHKNNEGASIARNLGIKKSKGKFLVFVDSDDYIASDYIQTFCEILSKYDRPDIIIQSPIYVDKGHEKYKTIKDTIYSQCAEIKEFVKSGMLDFTEPHSKIFKKSIILEHGIKFPEKVIIGEDGIFIANYLLYANKVVTSSKTGYFYIKSENSIQRKFYAPNIELRGITLWKKSLLLLMEHLSLRKDEPSIWKILSPIIKRYCFAIAKNSTLTFKEKIKWLNMLDKECFRYYGHGCNLTQEGKMFKYIMNKHCLKFILFVIRFSK